jgi:hypothetical protein
MIPRRDLWLPLLPQEKKNNETPNDRYFSKPSESLGMYDVCVCMYMYIYVCVCDMYMYIYMYIYTLKPAHNR